MATIRTKNSVSSGLTPSGLTLGELAINVTDKKLFVGNIVGGVVTLFDGNNIVTSVDGATGDVIVVTSINGCTGAIGITGTANEVEVTKVCPNITIGLPDNVTISGNLQVNGNINTNGFIEGLYINGGTF